MKPLEGLKVLDFSTLLPGPYATMMLADLGAEVLRVESPVRDDLVRSMAPQIDGQSAAFRYMNRGKQSMTLDLKHPEAKAVVHRLLADFDIVIEQFRPGVMQRFGLDFESLQSVKPDLVYCSITGYGQTGEWAQRAGHDLNFLALSGVSSHMGRQDQGPCPLGIQVADVAAGSHPAVVAILASVIQRDRTGKGSHIDISMADNSFALQALLAPGAINGLDSVGYETHFLNGGGFYDYYSTRDGRYMAVGSLEPQFRKRLLETVGAEELMNADDYSLKVALQDLFASRDMADWAERFAGVDACVEPVLTLEEAAEHPAFVSRELIQQTANGEKQIVSALRFGNETLPLGADAPLRGADTLKALNHAGFSDDEIEQHRAAGVFGPQ